MERKCPVCLKNKDTDCYYKDKSKKDGVRKECKECHKIQKKKYRAENKEKIKRKKAIYYIKNKENIDNKNRDNYVNNIERYKEYARIYRVNNKEPVKELKKEYYHNVQKNDIIFKFKRGLRGVVSRAFKLTSYKKDSKFFKILGASSKEIKQHIENQFTEGMNWGNYGRNGWHIDHIIPLSSGKCDDDYLRLTHYTNLQPLWAKDNLSKGAKLPK